MLDTDTKRRIDTARDILVGKVPDPKSQVEQITIALIYKFMDDMDAESEEFELSKQVLRCGTSIGANVEEAIGGQSREDFVSKMSIAYKEARETSSFVIRNFP